MNWTTWMPWLERCCVWAAMVLAVRMASAEQSLDLRNRLKDPAPAVRKQAALKLAQANDAEAIPVLIDLLAELPTDERRPVEEFLSELAGESAPVEKQGSEDQAAPKIRRDAWMAWWRKNDGPALLAVVRAHTLTPELRRKIQEHIVKLGDDDFSIREAATKHLFDLGRTTLPLLRAASKDRDPETARRARDLIARIERQPSRTLPAAVLRLLALRKPTGAVEALLDYFPNALEENCIYEIKNALAQLALRDGKPDTALVRALAGDRPQRRAVAAEALAQAGDKEAVPVLIDLLAVLPGEQAGEIEAALHQLAGDAAPQTPLGTTMAEKKKCRDAWSAWWKDNSESADMTRLAEPPQRGYTLICDCGRQRVLEIDRQGKERWAIKNLQGPVDAVLLPGSRILIAECGGNKVTERDLKGNVLWQKHCKPVNVQRLPNGNTFIASTFGQEGIFEVDRTGKELYRIKRVPGGVLAAYRTRRGDIFCLAREGNQCHRMDTTGKIKKTFTTNHNGYCLGGFDLLPNDHILVPQPGFGKIVEFDRDGKVVREVKAPHPTVVTQLPNGRILAVNNAIGRINHKGHVFELDRAGKIVWEQMVGIGNVFRARRR
jgi:HEAT repeat protein